MIVDGKVCQISTETLPLIGIENLFPLSILSIFQLIFFKLCIRVDIGEELFGIVDGNILSNKHRVIDLDLC